MGASQSSGWRFSSPQPWNQPQYGPPQYYAPRQPGLTLTLGGKRKKTRKNNKNSKKTRRNRK
jgi:hypothetical protein